MERNNRHSYENGNRQTLVAGYWDSYNYPPMNLGSRIKERLADLGMTQTALAKAVGVSQPTIADLISGESSGSKHLHKIAHSLQTTVAYLEGSTDDPDQGAPAPVSAEILIEQLNIASIREIDLQFGMGATYLEVPVTSQVRHFSREWLRQYTNANPDTLYFAQGIGDSMEPSIKDSDLLLIDASQTNVTLSDKFWAIAYGNTGAVKRLRPMPDGGIKILSDNPSVPPETAYDGELHVLGRVVAIIRQRRV